MLGVVLLLVALKVLAPFFHSVAGAQSASEGPAHEDVVNAPNTMWTLVAAFLVFFMQAGLHDAGGRLRPHPGGRATSSRSASSTRACAALLFWAFGFAFMFGAGNGWIGHQFFFLNDAPTTYGTTGVAFMAFFLFQFAFADTCSTITSGAMVGRTGFKGDLLYSIGVSGFIYPIIGHWVWGPDGWLGHDATALP